MMYYFDNSQLIFSSFSLRPIPVCAMGAGHILTVFTRVCIAFISAVTAVTVTFIITPKPRATALVS